ncbi:polysaccharide deacetylase family protein [Flavobacterium pedocola]
MRNFLLVLAFLFTPLLSKGQSYVAITIDDIPKGSSFQNSTGKPSLITTLDALNIPVAIFINEGKLFKSDSVARKLQFDHWLNRKYITLGNHTFAHSRYSEVGFEAFTEDIQKGAVLTQQWALKNKKKLEYFRFPYNDLGKDSLQHKAISDYLTKNHYRITPFTIESVDWMYNYVYEYYLNRKEFQKAEETGQQYVNKTLEYFAYMETISKEQYGRNIRHIYLCHDNVLNAVYLPDLIKALRSKKYEFISLKKALKDDVYEQNDYYTKKWGISWLYRWMNNPEKRMALMKKEPNTEAIETLYNSLQNK